VSEHEHAEPAAQEPTATAAPARAAGAVSPVALALGLQRTAGNAATARLLQRFVSPGARTTVSGQDDRALEYRRHEGHAFVRGAGEHSSGVDADDIAQGLLGDCYFLSPLAAAARINPGRVRQLIRGPVDTWADGTRVYEVDLYEGHWIGRPSRRTFRVTDRFVSTSSGDSRYAQPGDVAAGGGYDQAHSGLMSDGMTAVTGSDTDWESIEGRSDARIWRDIKGCVDAGKPITIQTKQQFTGDEMAEARDIEYTIFAKHAYNIASYNEAHQTIDIRNPHGNNHLNGFPLVRLRHFFDYYVMSENSFR
jgi:Calpain family cysteine protease